MPCPGYPTPDEAAKALYEAYCGVTDWKSAVSGDPLPSWEELKADPDRKLVVEGWLAVGQAAITKFVDPF